MKRMNAALLRSLALCAAVVVGGQAVADVSDLPQDIQDSLCNPVMLDPNQPIADSAYRDFVAKNPPPWKIGYASSYAGNTWRAAVMDRLQNTLIPKWQGLGLICEVIVTQSNLHDATQIQQMRQLVDQDVDAIIVCCSNPTALNQTVEYAHSKGVAVLSSAGYGQVLHQRFVLRVDETDFLVEVRNGKIVRISEGLTPNDMGFEFALRAASSAWSKFAQELPPPMFNDIWAISHPLHRNMTLDGNWLPFWQSIRALTRMLCQMRQV